MYALKQGAKQNRPSAGKGSTSRSRMPVETAERLFPRDRRGIRLQRVYSLCQRAFIAHNIPDLSVMSSRCRTHRHPSSPLRRIVVLSTRGPLRSLLPRIRNFVPFREPLRADGDSGRIVLQELLSLPIRSGGKEVPLGSPRLPPDIPALPLYSTDPNLR